MLRAGIVGLPNVGKSTLFNALVANAKAEAANPIDYSTSDLQGLPTGECYPFLRPELLAL